MNSIGESVLVDISIIVCTYNRAHSLANTLSSLAEAIRKVPYIEVEVVLVNNNSTDDTQNAIESWAAQMEFHVQLIQERQPGLSNARNAGVAASMGELLVFTDDDCTLNDDFLSRMLAHYEKDIEPTIRGGRVELGDPSDQPFSILLRDHIVRMTDLTSPGGFIIGANMTMKRDVLSILGPFDIRFGAGAVFMAGEDTDFIYRAHRAGLPVEYVPDMIVKHFHGRKDRSTINSLNYGYTIAEGALYAKHIRDGKLLKHFYWNCRTWLRTLGTKENVYDINIGATYTTLIWNNLKGMLMFCVNTIGPAKR